MKKAYFSKKSKISKITAKIEQIKIPHLAPNSLAQYPANHAPSGVEPKKNKLYTLITRPRNCGCENSCKQAFIAFRLIIKLNPVKTSPTPAQKMLGASPTQNSQKAQAKGPK